MRDTPPLGTLQRTVRSQQQARVPNVRAAVGLLGTSRLLADGAAEPRCAEATTSVLVGMAAVGRGRSAQAASSEQ